MILVDTSVWVDFFCNKQTKETQLLIKLIEGKETLCLCGVILTEILQGIKDQKEHRLVEKILENLIFLEMNREVFVTAADIFRLLRLRGITVRKTIDCIIAAVALENNLTLLHNDRDFDPIEKYCNLRAYQDGGE